MSSEFYEKLSKRIFLIAIMIFALAGAFVAGAIAYRDDLPPIPQLKLIRSTLFDSEFFLRRLHLQPSRGQGDGVTVNTARDDGALVLLAGFFEEENQIRLIERDGSVVKKWSLDYFEHFPDSETRVCDITSPLRVDTHGVQMTPQGELVFNYEHCGTVKLDQCGGVMWRIHEITHHSLVPAEEGGYWILGREEWRATDDPDRFYPFSTPATDEIIQEDELLRVTEDGEIVERFSIPQLMVDNGMAALLTANGEGFDTRWVGRTELIHANQATELSSEIADAFPLFEAGDLAISMRELNLVMVIDPDDMTVKWHQTGPWIRQHDAEFRPDGRLSIFNNNTYRTAYNRRGQTVLDTPFTTNIIAMDPVAGETEVIFGERPGQEMLSVIRGQHELLDDGGMLITEFDAGRVLEVDAEGQILWAYVNAYNERFVGEIINSLLYPAGYFEAEWETCAP